MKIHAPKRYSCAVCSALFGLNRDLTRHKKTCHKSILCATCHFTFSTREDLKLHCQLTKHEEYVFCFITFLTVNVSSLYIPCSEWNVGQPNIQFVNYDKPFITHF